MATNRTTVIPIGIMPKIKIKISIRNTPEGEQETLRVYKSEKCGPLRAALGMVTDSWMLQGCPLIQWCYVMK